MPPALHKSRIQATQITAGKMLATVFCTLLVAGCQSHSTQDDDDWSFSKRSSEIKRYFTYDSDNRTYQQPKARDWEDQEGQAPSPLAHQDIWGRMRTGFQLQKNMPNQARISQHRKRFSDNPATLRAVSKRSAPYIHYIVERLEEQNMPLELALLPIIESSYNPFAYSPAQAVGLWQFIPSTGQYYNLRQTRWYDGRRDITASTNAALRYLSYLHKLFDGDWLLALAAYNSGEGTVGRAIEANKKQGLPTDYWSLPLPQETRDYVPKLLAVSQLIMNPQAYGISLSPVPNEPYFEVVRLNRNLNLAHAAKLAELDEDELYRLNPAFTKGVTQDGPKQLLVPTDKAGLLTNNLARLEGQTPEQYEDQLEDLPEPTLNWDMPKRMANRYGSGRQFQEVNQAIVREIEATQTLSSMSGKRQRIEHILSPVSASMRPAAATVTRAVTTESASEKRTSAIRTYRVKSGESLQQISKNQKVSMADLQRWNQLAAGSRLKPGQVLNLQSSADSKTNKSAAVAVAKPTLSLASTSKGATTSSSKSSKQQAATVYKVKKGESIREIAKRFNVQPKALQSWNPGSQELKPGQVLTLYLPR